MRGRPFAKGRSGNPHGRKKGEPNRVTSDVREAVARFAQEHAGEMSDWLRAIGDPARRLELYLRALEYHVPKLARTEISGKDGKPMQVSIQINRTVQAEPERTE